MIKPFTNRHLPLAVKNALIYLILIILSSFLIGYTIYRLSAALIIATSKAKIKNDVQHVALKMTSQFDHVGRDIQYLVNSPILKSFIGSTVVDVNLHRNTLIEDLRVLLESRPSYFQIRVIGVDHQGKELARVDRVGGVVKVVEDKHLQEKGDRSYFAETIKLQPGSIYYSEIDLNKEYGKIEIPYRPTLRVASPLFIDHKVFGIVIINIDLRDLFSELKRTVSADEELFVFNNAGYFLIHPDDAENFGFEFGRPPNVYHWFRDLNLLDQDFHSFNKSDSLVDNEKRVTVFYTLLHPRTGYKLFMALRTSERYLLYPFISWRKNTILLTIGITFAFLGIAFLWMRRQSKELKRITSSMVKFSENYSESNLPTNNTDEIGDLANAFSKMATTIRDNVKDLESSKEIAIQANQSKEEFLENMSHEIRNPLQSILGMTNILEQNHPRPDQRAVIKTIQFSSNQLLSLVNDILDFSKIRIGLIQLHPQDIKLNQLLSDIIKSHLFLAQSKNVELRYEIPIELDKILVHVDALRLSQILNNLIVNAIKFTPSGESVLLKVSAEVQSHQVLLNMMIADRGVGISPDEVEMIKGRYYSGGTIEKNNQLTGAGLGLPIVIQLLKLFNSELHVESQLNQGSTFSFAISLPYSTPDTTDLDSKFTSRTIPLEIRSILCIDDDPQLLYFFKHNFKSDHIKLTCIQDENSIRDIQVEYPFDLILTDYLITSMPLEQYVRLLLPLKSASGLLIVFSGMDSIQVESSVTVGIDAFFQKPMSTDMLNASIYDLWNARHFSLPRMHSFYQDYDYDITPVSNALNILIEEWKIMRHQFHLAIQTIDQELYTQGYHKIITSIRRFDLDPLHHTLKTIQSRFDMKEAIEVYLAIQLDHQMKELELFFSDQLKNIEKVLKK